MSGSASTAMRSRSSDSAISCGATPMPRGAEPSSSTRSSSSSGARLRPTRLRAAGYRRQRLQDRAPAPPSRPRRCRCARAEREKPSLSVRSWLKLLGEVGAWLAMSYSASSRRMRAARHVLRLGEALAPGGELHQHGQRLAVLDAQLQPLPGIRRAGCRTFVGSVRTAISSCSQSARPVFLEIGLQMLVDVAQMRHVAERVVELLVRQRPPAPVGEARGSCRDRRRSTFLTRLT